MEPPNDNRADTQTLTERLQFLAAATEEDLDKLLTNLLCEAYRTREIQNA